MRQNEKERKNSGFKIPESAKTLAKLEWKKYKKKNKEYFDSKKELKRGYFAEIIDLLPESIVFIVRFGHQPEVKETKEAIFAKLVDEDFTKYLRKELKNGLEFDNMLLLPILIDEITKEAARQVAAAKAENPEADVTCDLSELIEISTLILKKKIKKLTKAGIDEAVAFDILCTIPDTEVLKKSQYFHIRKFFGVIYEHAKTKEIKFKEIMKVIFKNSDYIGSIIAFALLERKDKIGNFNESQMRLFNDITTYCFTTMEEMDKEDITNILKAYCDSRKKDEAQNKDANRRYYISQLPESDYPKILKVVTRMCERDENLKKYFL